MTTRARSVTLLERPPEDPVLRFVTLSDRLSAHLRGAALDRALAAGATPESEPALTLHARKLIAPRTRRRLALTIRRLVDMTRRPPRPPLRPPGIQVALAGAELLALAERLAEPGAVDARGVALVRVMLQDGGGPLHSDRGADRLAAAAHEAAAALDP